jgi:hypothetical protein
MTKSKRGRYTLEFKQEAARLVESASLRLAIVDPGNHRAGSLEVPLRLAPPQQADSGVPQFQAHPYAVKR